MTKQLPIINETRGINASVSTSFTLLGRGLAVIQSNKLTTPVKVDNAKLLPALSKLMSALIVMGYINFKENAIAALAAIREKFGDAATDLITIEHLQGAYIGMKKGKTLRKEVVRIESIEELYLDEELSLSITLDKQTTLSKKEIQQISKRVLERVYSVDTQKKKSQPENENNETNKPPNQND